jgi:putative acetyltransferase
MHRLVRRDPRDPDLRALIAGHAAHAEAHYPSESNHHQDAATLHAEAAVMLVVEDSDSRPLGMGAYKPLDAALAELKSMHVIERARGSGIGRWLLIALLDHARAQGFRRIALETGSRDASAAARRLYERAGFAYCPPFGRYRDDPMSVFMSRALEKTGNIDAAMDPRGPLA